MNEKVKVSAHPETGLVVTTSESNPAWGSIRVEQERAVIDEATGFLRIKRLSALIPGLVEDLRRLGWKDGQELDGKIVFREQMLPFNKKNPENNLKIAGDTEVVCKVNGEPIYRNTFYNPRPDAQDSPIPHTNQEEIKAAYAEMRKDELQEAPDTLDL